MGTKTLLLLIVCIGILQATAIAQTQKDTDTKTRSDKGEAVAEALIRQRVEDYAKAVREKDIDRVMSLYAPKIVSFDINPPLQYARSDYKRRAWQEFFATYTGPVAYEVRDLNVTTHGELAFVHSLNHVKGTLASGHITNLWVRWTASFRRIDGVWLV